MRKEGRIFQILREIQRASLAELPLLLHSSKASPAWLLLFPERRQDYLSQSAEYSFQVFRGES
jgi:hypothetical protein